MTLRRGRENFLKRSGKKVHFLKRIKMFSSSFLFCLLWNTKKVFVMYFLNFQEKYIFA